MASLARVLKLLRETEEFEQLVPALLEALQKELHYTLLWLGLYDRPKHHVVSQGFIAPQPHRLLKSTFALDAGDLMEQVLMQQRPLLVNDLRQESRIGAWNELAAELNVQGALLFPIRRRDVCYGMFLFGSPQWGQPISASDRTFISTTSSTLADLLCQREQVQQEQLRKNPGDSIFGLLGHLQGLTDSDAQLEVAAKAIFQLIEPDQVRLFWLNPEKFEFWERLSLSARRGSSSKRFVAANPGLTLPISEIRGVYQVLNNQQLLVIGESQGSVMANVPKQFLQSVNAEALLAAPIFAQDALVGFVSVQSKSSRLWSDYSRDYLKGVAHLIGLLMPGQQLNVVQQQADANLQLLTGIVRSIQSDTDWRKTLEACSTGLHQRLGTDQFIVLLHDAERGGYKAVFQKNESKRKDAALIWDALDEVDWQMLERSDEAIAINDLTNDLKLLAWRENFQTLQMQSLMASNVSPGNPPEGIVLLGSRAPRHWQRSDQQLLQKVAQQVGLILNQWQLQQQAHQQEDLYESIQWGLRMLQQTFQLDQLEAAACRRMVDLLGISLVVLVSWQTGEQTAQVSHTINRHKDFGVVDGAAIPVGADAVINWALQTDGPLTVNWEDFPEDTRAWLMAPPASKFVLVALRTAEEHTPNGVWLMADKGDRKWTAHQLSLISLLANQLAWSRRHLSVVDLLMSHRETLTSLNWYKQKRFDEVYSRLAVSLQRLSDPITQGKGLTAQRQLQLTRQLNNLLANMKGVLEDEEWQLQNKHQTTPIISLVNRLMERANASIQARQLWAKVHNESNVIVSGDLEKVEFVLYEVMSAACERSPEQGRLDIWCRPLDRNWLELSITDDGEIAEEILHALHEGRSDDVLVPSPLDEPPGLHFSICQTLMQQIGGEFTLQKLEDGRMMSRLILAISGKNKPLPKR